MRNDRARYLNTKPIEDSGPQWSRGCPSCSYGILSAPELTGAADLHLERLVQAIAGDLKFCECQAGTRYRVYLLNRRQKLIEEARKDPRMTAQAQRLTHADIEISAHAIAHSYAMRPAPSVHGVGERR